MGKKSSNRLVDSLILCGSLEMDEFYFHQQRTNYLHELQLIDSGVSFSELGIKERKKAQVPKVMTFENGVLQMHDLDEESTDFPKGSIARLQLKGVMRVNDGLSTRGIQSLCSDIERCNNTKGIEAIVLEANTGGGESLAGQMLKNAIKDSTIPVVVLAHFLGSAGVHGTLPANKIIAAGKGSEIGSIGSMVSIDKRVAAWYKENIDDIYSKVSPDKNKEWREYQKGNKGPLIASVTQNAQTFQNEVAAYRPLKESLKKTTLSGGMFPAEEAQERGLIDGIGTFEDALSIAKGLISESQQVKIKKQNKMKIESFLQVINSMFGTSFTTESKEADIKQGLEASRNNLIEETTKKVKDEMQAQIDQLKQQVESKEGVSKQEFEALKAQFASVQSELKGLKTENETLKTDKTNLEAANATLTTQKESLEGQVSTLEGEKENAATQLNEANLKIAKLKGKKEFSNHSTQPKFKSTADTFKESVEIEIEW